MIQLESNSPRGLEYELRKKNGVTGLAPEPVFKPELRLEYQGRHIPLTVTGLQILSQLESERAYEELIRPGPPYRSGNLEELKRFFANSGGRELAEKELIPLGLIEIDPDGDSKNVYHLSAIAQQGKYVAVMRDERVNS